MYLISMESSSLEPADLALGQLDYLSIHHITDYLSKNDLVHWSLTSREWLYYFQPEIFRSMTIYFPLPVDRRLTRGAEELERWERDHFHQLVEDIHSKSKLVKEVRLIHELNLVSTVEIFTCFNQINVLKLCFLSIKITNLLCILKLARELRELHMIFATLYDSPDAYDKGDYFKLPDHMQVLWVDVRPSINKLPPPLECIDDSHCHFTHISLLNAAMATNFVRPYRMLTHVDIKDDATLNSDIVLQIVANNPQLKHVGTHFNHLTEQVMNSILTLNRLKSLEIVTIHRPRLVNSWFLVTNATVETLTLCDHYNRNLIADLLGTLKALKKFSVLDCTLCMDIWSAEDFYSPTVEFIEMTSYCWPEVDFDPFNKFDSLKRITLGGIGPMTKKSTIRPALKRLHGWKVKDFGEELVISRRQEGSIDCN